MKKIAIAMLTTAMISTAAFAASNNPQAPQGQNDQGQKNNGQAQQNNQNQQSASNDKVIAPQNLRRGEIRQVQQALDKDGFKAGTTDGRWGPRTEDAIKQFQQSKQIQANGQLTQQTVADLGLDASKFTPSQAH